MDFGRHVRDDQRHDDRKHGCRSGKNRPCSTLSSAISRPGRLRAAGRRLSGATSFPVSGLCSISDRCRLQVPECFRMDGVSRLGVADRR
jgi:hypothetical protein